MNIQQIEHDTIPKLLFLLRKTEDDSAFLLPHVNDNEIYLLCTNEVPAIVSTRAMVMHIAILHSLQLYWIHSIL